MFQTDLNFSKLARLLKVPRNGCLVFSSLAPVAISRLETLLHIASETETMSMPACSLMGPECRNFIY